VHVKDQIDRRSFSYQPGQQGAGEKGLAGPRFAKDPRRALDEAAQV